MGTAKTVLRQKYNRISELHGRYYIVSSKQIKFSFLILNTINPLLSPLGGLFISSPFEGGGGLIEMGGLLEGGGLFERGELNRGFTVIYKKQLRPHLLLSNYL